MIPLFRVLGALEEQDAPPRFDRSGESYGRSDSSFNAAPFDRPSTGTPCANFPRMYTVEIEVRTGAPRDVIFVSKEVSDAVVRSEIRDGLCLVSVPHTSCAVTLNENADPAVPSDLLRAWEAMVPNVRFEHGEDNSDAHLLSSMIGTSVTIPVIGGRLELGRWQAIWFVELDGPRSRRLRISCLG